MSNCQGPCLQYCTSYKLFYLIIGILIGISFILICKQNNTKKHQHKTGDSSITI